PKRENSRNMHVLRQESHEHVRHRTRNGPVRHCQGRRDKKAYVFICFGARGNRKNARILPLRQKLSLPWARPGKEAQRDAVATRISPTSTRPTPGNPAMRFASSYTSAQRVAAPFRRTTLPRTSGRSSPKRGSARWSRVTASISHSPPFSAAGAATRPG